MNISFLTAMAITSQMVVTAIEDANFVPIDPQRPQGAQMAVLWGDKRDGRLAWASR